MIERLVVAVIALAAIVALAALVRWVLRRWQRRVAAGQALPAGERPLLLYFSGAWCVVCRAQQEPALEQVRRLAPVAFELRKVDVAGEPELAQRFGVLTVPTTVVIDRHGTVRAINNGFAPARALIAQLGEC